MRLDRIINELAGGIGNARERTGKEEKGVCRTGAIGNGRGR